MQQTKRGGAWRTVAKIVVSLLVGFVVFVLLFPIGRVDTLPVQCLSMFGYGVPCDAGWAPAAGAGAAAVVGVLLWLKDRRG